ncbi:MAG: GNAT family N-acetyltransferase [Burkholderiales bacterium]|jgi:ribosomal protein S18 acetylase RimI-like enzyme|nr:GNAT family N-acetyltransferase [Nitrosomonadaceae bacterium]
MTFRLRPAARADRGDDVEADLQVVRDIAYATWPDTFRDILAPGQITYMLEWLYAIPRLRTQVASREHEFYLAEMDGRPVGFCAHQLEYPEPGLSKIHKLYLLPETQGHGIGKALVMQVASEANAAGHRAVVLNVNKYNRAVGFYEAIGFVRDREEVIDIGGGYVMDDYVMRLDLPSTR